MILRDLKLSDLNQIDAFWQKHHKGIRGIPERKFLVSEAVAESGGRIIGYGNLRYFAEALMFLDKDASTYQQAKAFRLMMNKAIMDAKKIGLDNINIGVDDLHFRMVLQSKFHLTNRGTVLSLGLNNEQPEA